MKYTSNHYTVRGEYLEFAGGGVVQMSRYEEARKRVHAAPAEVTDDDLAVLENFGGVQEADRAATARRTALHPGPPPAPSAVKAAPVDLDARLRAGTRLVQRALAADDIKDFDRAAFVARVVAQAKSAVVRIGIYDRVRYLTALAQFKAAPTGLTDDDLEQLRTVDAELGERARAAKAGYVEAQKAAPKDDPLATIPASVRGLVDTIKAVREDVEERLLTLFFRSRESAARLDALEATSSTKGDGNLSAAVQRLQQRVETLEARGSFDYRGVWEDGQEYTKGDFVTWGGAMWCCQKTHRGVKPVGDENDPAAHDTSSRVWKLAVRRGREGKQGPPGGRS